MKRALLFVLLSAVPACAQETQVAASSPAASPTGAPVAGVAPLPATTAGTPEFLTSHGVVSSQELVAALNTPLTPEQRAQLDQALAKRNAALAKANDELSATLRGLLRETNEGLTHRIDEGAEARRMERMRRLQPGRYEQLMGRKKKDQKSQTSTDH